MSFYTLGQIADALNSKNANQPCPRCGGVKFSVLGESHTEVLSKGEGILSGPYEKWSKIPTVLVTCDNCGYLSQHAQATLEDSPPKSALRGPIND